MFSELKAFFRAPFDTLATDATLGDKIGLLFKLLVLDLVIALMLGGVIGLVESLDIVDMDNHAVAQALQQFTVWQIMLIAILGTPFVEELVFRLPLRYETNPIAGLARIFTPRLAVDDAEVIAAKRRATWDQYYRFTFYGLAIAFALIHLTNYPELSLGLLLLSPLLVAPQFVMGCLAGYLRVRFGFIWAFLLHALHNLVLVGLAVLGAQATEIVSIENDDYRLHVEEVSPMERELDFSYTFGEDTIGYVNTELSEVIRTLALPADTVFVKMGVDMPNPRLNAGYKGVASEKSSKDLLLEQLSKHYEFRLDQRDTQDTIYVEAIIK